MGYSVLSITAMRLDRAREDLFRQTAFSEVFVELHDAPYSITRRIEEIQGVERASGRIVKTIPLSYREEGVYTDAELRLVSYDNEGLNHPFLVRGMYPLQGSNAILLGEGFFDARNLLIGDTVALSILGRSVALEVSGSAISPEHLYMVKSMVDMIPNYSQYDAGYVRHGTMERLFAMEGRINNVVIALTSGTTLEDVEESIRQVLRPFGCYRVYDRATQLSSAVLDLEIAQLHRMTRIVPALFLSISAVVLYITLSRLVERQRTQVGTMMALGLGKNMIALHYSAYGAIVGAVGGFIGVVLGVALSGPMANLFAVFFMLPVTGSTVSWHYLLTGVLAPLLFCAGTAFISVYASTRMQPAEALRPAPPESARVSALEKLPFLMKALTVPGVIAIRGIVRNRNRSALSVFGVACAFMITATLLSVTSLLDAFVYDNLRKTQQQDITVTFEQPVLNVDMIRALRHPSIEALQGVVEVPATLRGPNGKVDCIVQGMAADTPLTRLYNLRGEELRVVDSGILISHNIAYVLGVTPGMTVDIEVTFPTERTTRVPVIDVVELYIGSTVYTTMNGVARISDYGSAVTAALIKAPEAVRNDLIARLASVSSSVQSREERIEQLQFMMNISLIMLVYMTAIGVAVGVAVVYVGSVICYEELKREISTMLVLGLTSKQCLEVISTGQYILSVFGIALGIPMTFVVSKLMITVLSGEMFTLPSIVQPSKLTVAAMLVLVSVALSSSLLHRTLKRITPADMLRDRE